MTVRSILTIALVAATIVVTVVTMGQLPSAAGSIHVGTIRGLNGLALPMRATITSFDCAAADSVIYLACEVRAITSDNGPKVQDGLWIWHLNLDGVPIAPPLRLTKDWVHDERVKIYGDSIFVAYGSEGKLGLFAASVGGQDWRSRILFDGAPGPVSGITWLTKGTSEPALLCAATSSDPPQSAADSAHYGQLGLYQVTGLDDNGSVRQLVSSPRAIHRQLEPIATTTGIFWVSYEIAGWEIPAKGMSFRSPVARTYILPNGSNLTRQASNTLPWPATQATALSQRQEMIGLLLAGYLFECSSERPAVSKVQRATDVVDPEWVYECQGMETAVFGGKNLLAWIDGRNQVDPMRKAGMVDRLLSDQGPWPNADVYIGFLERRGKSLVLTRPTKVTQGTPMVNDLRLLKTSRGMLLFWSGKQRFSPNVADRIFVAPLSMRD